MHKLEIIDKHCETWLPIQLYNTNKKTSKPNLQ